MESTRHFPSRSSLRFPPGLEAVLAQLTAPTFHKEWFPALRAASQSLTPPLDPLLGPFRCQQREVAYLAPSTEPADGMDWSVVSRMTWLQAHRTQIPSPALRDALLRASPQAMEWNPGLPEERQGGLWVFSAAVRDTRSAAGSHPELASGKLVRPVFAREIAETLLDGPGPSRQERIGALGRSVARAVQAACVSKDPHAGSAVTAWAEHLFTVNAAFFHLSPARRPPPVGGTVGRVLLDMFSDPAERLACVAGALEGWGWVLRYGQAKHTQQVWKKLATWRMPEVLPERAADWRTWMAPAAAAWATSARHAMAHNVGTPWTPQWGAHALAALVRTGHEEALGCLGEATAVLERLEALGDTTLDAWYPDVRPALRAWVLKSCLQGPVETRDAQSLGAEKLSAEASRNARPRL